MFKLVLEKAEEPEIKLPTSAVSWKKQESSRKTSISALLTMPKPLTVWFTINCGKSWERWEYQTTWLASCSLIQNVLVEMEIYILIKEGLSNSNIWPLILLIGVYLILHPFPLPVIHNHQKSIFILNFGHFSSYKENKKVALLIGSIAVFKDYSMWDCNTKTINFWLVQYTHM